MWLQKIKDPLFKGALFCVEGYSRVYGLCQTLTFLMPELFVTFVHRFFEDFKDFGLLAHLVLYMPGKFAFFCFLRPVNMLSSLLIRTSCFC